MTTITAGQATIAKRHARKPARSHRPYGGYRTALWIYAGAFYTFLYGPLLLIEQLSFNNSEIVGFPFHGFTVRWYEVVFASPALLKALGNSVGVGILAAAIATTLALSLASRFTSIPLKARSRAGPMWVPPPELIELMVRCHVATASGVA